MHPFAYFFGRALQIAGFLTLTAVVVLFFYDIKMGLLLKLALAGIVEFYGGTWLLEQGSSQ